MRVGVYYKENYLDVNKSYIEKIKKNFADGGVEVRIAQKFSEFEGLDILLVLGGDGTILTVAAECAKRNIKILGINYGHLGFLTEFEPEKLDEAIRLLLSGSYEVLKRTMLEVTCGNDKYLALNDLVIQRSTDGYNFSNTIGLQAKIDGYTVDNYTSDGIIVSTPTGSTAYSLSAGGSILAPDIDAFIMTPICAHSLHSKPVVYSSNSLLEIVPNGTKSLLNLIVDGRIVKVFKCSESVRVKKSDIYSRFLTFGNKNFFEKLLMKLNIWSK